jgi:hypothetical protein
MVEKARALLASPSKDHPHKVGMLLVVEKESVLKTSELLREWKSAFVNAGFLPHRYTLLTSDQKKMHAFSFVKADAISSADCTSLLRLKNEI